MIKSESCSSVQQHKSAAKENILYSPVCAVRVLTAKLEPNVPTLVAKDRQALITYQSTARQSFKVFAKQTVEVCCPSIYSSKSKPRGIVEM